MPVLAKAPTLYVLTKKSNPLSSSNSIHSAQQDIWLPTGSFTYVFSSHCRFFECERLCDRDPCCTGFGFLNVSQLQGKTNEGGSP